MACFPLHPHEAHLACISCSYVMCSECQLLWRAGTCDICARSAAGNATHSDVDASALAQTVVAAVRDLNGRDTAADLAAAKALINVRACMLLCGPTHCWSNLKSATCSFPKLRACASCVR
jgi:hypothetical protein